MTCGWGLRYWPDGDAPGRNPGLYGSRRFPGTLPSRRARQLDWAWKLNVQQCTFGKILAPGLPAGVTLASQTLKIERAAEEIRLSADTVVSSSDRPYHDDNRLSLTGKETVVGPVSLSLRRVDDTSFDIVSKLTGKDGGVVEVSHFAFSSDGAKLTETKTQGGATRASTFVLVFNKDMVLLWCYKILLSCYASTYLWPRLPTRQRLQKD